MDADIARLLNSSAEDRQKALDLISEYWNDPDDDTELDSDDEFDKDLECLVPPDSDEEAENQPPRNSSKEQRADVNNNSVHVGVNSAPADPVDDYGKKMDLIMLKAQQFTWVMPQWVDYFIIDQVTAFKSSWFFPQNADRNTSSN